MLRAFLGLSCVVFFTQNLLGQADVKDLQEIAENIGAEQPDSARLLLRQADALAKKYGNTMAVSENHWIRAKIFYLRKSYDSMQYYADLSIETGKTANDKSSLAKVYNLLGVVSRRTGDYDRALLLYKSSLAYRIELNDSTGMGKTLQNLGALYQQKGLPDSAFFYNSRSFLIKRAIGDSLSLGKAIANFGAYYYEIGLYDSAVHAFTEAFDIYRSTGYSDGMARVYNNIGASYRNLGYYRKALASFTKGVQLYDSLELPEEKANTFYNIASLYTRLRKFKTALDYYEQVLSIHEESGKILGKAEAYLNMADIMLFTEKPDSAIIYLQKSEAFYKQANEFSERAALDHGYGRAHSQKKDFVLAKDYFLKSINRLQEMGDIDALGPVYNSYAVSLYNEGQLNESAAQYRKSLNLGKEFKKPDVIKASLLGLAETNEALGDFRKAYDYRLQYEVVKDSLDSVEKSGQIAELQEIYESEQKDKQITQLELENRVVGAQSEANAAQAAKQKADKLTFIVLTVALLILATIVYFYLRQRLALARLREKEEREAHIKSVNELLTQQQTKTLEAMVQGQEQERLRIANELHDHFGSLMAAVKVNLTTVTANNSDILENDRQMKNLSVLVDQACEDIRSLSHSMHVGISESFGLVRGLRDLAESVTASGRIEVTFQSTSCADKLDSVIEVTAYRLVQELVSNALKHAKATKLTVQLTCLDHLLNIIVEDNGKGFDALYYMEHSEGIGLKSMQERISAMHGEFEVDSQPGKGTTVVIDLPVSLEQRTATL